MGYTGKDGMQARVQVCGSLSEPFDVKVGVKQGCVLAPVLFNIYLLTLAQLAHAAFGRDAVITIQYRLDGSLFNIRRFQARTKVSSTQIIELQYADDCAIIAHDAVTLQAMIDTFSSTYSAMGLKINAQKTEILAQCIIPPEAPFHFHINGDPIKTIDSFTYLGSVVSSDCSHDLEIQRRVNLASTAFGRLRERVFSNNNLRVDTKAAVYRAVCISTLLYGSEGWTLYRRHINILEKFHIRCIQRIVGVTWKDKVTYEELYHRTQTCSIETLLAQRQLRWLGHTIRMPQHRLPRQILYGQLNEGGRTAGGPKKRYKDQCKTLLKRCNMQPRDLETLAMDRKIWRTACVNGTTRIEQEISRKRTEKRIQRHQGNLEAVPVGQYPCHRCDKVCGSRIGLNSHLRWHQRNHP